MVQLHTSEDFDVPAAAAADVFDTKDFMKERNFYCYEKTSWILVSDKFMYDGPLVYAWFFKTE